MIDTKVSCLGAIGGTIALLIVNAAQIAWTAWTIMLLVGVLHSWNTDIPTLSYAIALPIGFLFNALMGIAGGASK